MKRVLTMTLMGALLLAGVQGATVPATAQAVPGTVVAEAPGDQAPGTGEPTQPGETADPADPNPTPGTGTTDEPGGSEEPGEGTDTGTEPTQPGEPGDGSGETDGADGTDEQPGEPVDPEAEGDADPGPGAAESTPAPIALNAVTAASPVTAGFNAGYIISDVNFYNGNSMTVDQIQQFLNQRLQRCIIGTPGYEAGRDLSGPYWGANSVIASNCLKDMRFNSGGFDANQYCKGYAPTNNESAAQIISRVAKACGINPKVLLVMLEKEQSLVGDDWPFKRQYDRAMGYACPDSGPNSTANCNSKYYGFFNQVYYSAWQFRVYQANPGWYGYRAGQYNAVKWAPNDVNRVPVDCGTSQVYIANAATAALYIYTPYRPNQAALDAGWGTGDGCSSYGNRNFYNFYKAWFGSPNTRYADVTTNSIFYKHIEWMAVNGYAASGPDVTNFNPTSATTRGAMATFMRRMIEPGYTGPSAATVANWPFADVKPGDTHYLGVAWLLERKLVVRADHYYPERATTRGAMATFLYRIRAGVNDNVTSAPPYRDVPATHDHAKAIAWMAAKGYAAKGASNPDYNPAAPVTRQSMAAFLYRIFA